MLETTCVIQKESTYVYEDTRWREKEWKTCEDVQLEGERSFERPGIHHSGKSGTKWCVLGKMDFKEAVAIFPNILEKGGLFNYDSCSYTVTICYGLTFLENLSCVHDGRISMEFIITTFDHHRWIWDVNLYHLNELFVLRLTEKEVGYHRYFQATQGYHSLGLASH